MVLRRAHAIIGGAFLLAACSSRVTNGDSSGTNPEDNPGAKSLGRRATSGSGGAPRAAEVDTAESGGVAQSTVPSDDEPGAGGAQRPANAGGRPTGAGGASVKDGEAATGRDAGKGVDASVSPVKDGGSTPTAECTDIQTSDHQGEPCSIWVQWGHCDKDWLQGYCNKTCGRCNGTTTSTTTNPSTTPTTTPTSTQTVPPLGNDAQQGWASRYWDCCKPHCAWPGKSSGGPMKMCTSENKSLPDSNAVSSCDPNGTAYTCWDMAAWAVSEKLAYGYAATPANGNDCGKCYQLDFTGVGHHNANDPGSKAIAGKSIIVQATNIGGDVGTGQFDILVPGGGVGKFNGCAHQWGTSDLGETYGGFVNACDNSTGGNYEALKSCVLDKCKQVFGTASGEAKPGMGDLLKGCRFYVEWFQAANNPNLRYKQVPCPAAITAKSGMSG